MWFFNAKLLIFIILKLMFWFHLLLSLVRAALYSVSRLNEPKVSEAKYKFDFI